MRYSHQFYKLTISLALAIEKEMVPSRSDREEKSCMKCGKAFNLLQRRKYLCLLCGDAICDGCSLFVSLSEICESPGLVRREGGREWREDIW